MSVPSEPSNHTPGGAQRHHRHHHHPPYLHSLSYVVFLNLTFKMSHPWRGSPARRCRTPILCLCSRSDSSTVYNLRRCPLSQHIHSHQLPRTHTHEGNCTIETEIHRDMVCSLTVEDLIVAWIRHDVLPVFGPVQVGDEAGVTLRWHMERFSVTLRRFNHRLSWGITASS